MCSDSAPTPHIQSKVVRRFIRCSRIGLLYLVSRSCCVFHQGVWGCPRRQGHGGMAALAHSHSIGLTLVIE